jgi:hypothetical protein
LLLQQSLLGEKKLNLTKSENKLTKFKILLVFFLIVLPFFNSNFSDNIIPEKVTTELAFYEINTCSISLGEFLIHNPNVIYQDHYRIVTNDYSSIKCFGTITGVDYINNIFYISIGTNSVINLFLQSAIWLLLLSFIKSFQKVKLNLKTFTLIFCTSIFITLGIFNESRYYSKKLYLFDMSIYKTYIYIFIYIFAVTFFLFLIVEQRNNHIINYLPYTFLFIQIWSGFNIYFLSLYIITVGFSQFQNQKILKSFYYMGVPITFFWAYQAIGQNYFIDPDKVRGSINTIYSFPSIVYATLFFVTLLLGAIKIFNDSKKHFNLYMTGKNILISTNLILIFGLLSSTQPLFNFFTYYFFGLNKFGTTNQDLFGSNQWGEKIPWRGQFPSAETIGEFAALGLLIIFLSYMDLKQTKEKVDYIIFCLIPLTLLTLYLADNRASFILLLICILLKIYNTYRVKSFYKYSLIFLLVVIILPILKFENIIYSFTSASTKMFNDSILYGLDYNYSSSVQYLSSLLENNDGYPIILTLIGQLGFLINRSEIWAIFLSRYNPTLSEFLIGTGPLQFGNHYGEIDIYQFKLFTNTQIAFLLPHSSFLVLLMYFGVIGLLMLVIVWIFYINKSRKINYNSYVINIFIFFNLLKSDSMLYLPSFLVFLFFINTLHTNEDHHNLDDHG